MKTNIKLLTLVILIAVATVSFTFAPNSSKKERKNTKVYEEPIGGFLSEEKFGW